jgi:hypothetical protein
MSRGRELSPPPDDYEPKYLVVMHPYPLNANLKEVVDRRALVRWLACCTGRKELVAMFHKPTVSFRSLTRPSWWVIRPQSPGMVVIAIDSEYDGFNDLLGTHSWSKILLKPMKEETGKSSEVFYFNLDTGHSIDKNGVFSSGGKQIMLLFTHDQVGNAYGSKNIGFTIGALISGKRYPNTLQRS